MTEDEKWKLKLWAFGRNYDSIAEDDSEYYDELWNEFLEKQTESYVNGY